MLQNVATANPSERQTRDMEWKTSMGNYNAYDVMLGSGGPRGRNALYMAKGEEVVHDYDGSDMVAWKVIAYILDHGGRFFRRKNKYHPWLQLTDLKTIKGVVKQMLRDKLGKQKQALDQFAFNVDVFLRTELLDGGAGPELQVIDIQPLSIDLQPEHRKGKKRPKKGESAKKQE